MLPPTVKSGMLVIVIILLLLNIIEMWCYVILFRFLHNHNNRVVISVLKPEVVQQRNAKNAISLAGQLSTCVVEISYAVLGLFFIVFDYDETTRELVSFVKLSEFALIPLVQILCTPPLRSFALRRNPPIN